MGYTEYFEDHGVWRLGWYYPDAEYDGHEPMREVEVDLAEGGSFSGTLAEAFVALSKGATVAEVEAQWPGCGADAEKYWNEAQALANDPTFKPHWPGPS